MRSRTLKAAVLSVVLTIGVFAGPALADYPPAEPPEEPKVIDVVVEKEEVVEVAEPVTVVAMPVTGADATSLAVGGIALLALGALALRRRDPSGVN